MAHIIYPDATLKEVQPKNGKDFQLEELQEIVGGYIEIVSQLRTNTGEILVINEEGKLIGLPYNDVASLLYVGFPPDPIVGTVLLCKKSEVK